MFVLSYLLANEEDEEFVWIKDTLGPLFTHVDIPFTRQYFLGFSSIVFLFIVVLVLVLMRKR